MLDKVHVLPVLVSLSPHFRHALKGQSDSRLHVWRDISHQLRISACVKEKGCRYFVDYGRTKVFVYTLTSPYFPGHRGDHCDVGASHKETRQEGFAYGPISFLHTSPGPLHSFLVSSKTGVAAGIVTWPPLKLEVIQDIAPAHAQLHYSPASVTRPSGP